MIYNKQGSIDHFNLYSDMTHLKYFIIYLSILIYYGLYTYKFRNV